MKKTGKMGTIVKLKFLFSVVLLLWLAGGSCVEKEQGQEDFLAWKRIEQKPQVIDRSKKNIHLQQIVFLNEVYQNFESLSAKSKTVLEKYEYDLSLCRVLKGSEKRKRNSLEVSGGEIVLSIEPDNELMKAKTLNLLELEGAVNQDVEIQVFMIPKGINPPGREGQWYGNFILQKYVPLFSAKKYQRITLDLSQRFGWEKKTIERLTIKITPVEDKECRIKIKGLRMLSHSSYLVEKIPSMGYYRYGGADRNRLKSVFLPVGSEITYLISTQSNNPVKIDGHLGSVDGWAAEIEIWVNGELLSKENVAGNLRRIKKEVIPERRRLKLDIRISGETGHAGLLGNLSLYHDFKEKRNVVFYLIDALRADKGGIEKELFEKEFKDGAVFRKAYANATRTADSLPALFSGKYKFTLVEKDEEVPFLSNRELLLTEHFKTKGYTTVAFTNNPWLALSNSTQGFDYVYFCWDPVKESRYIPSPEDYNRMKYGNLKSFLESFVRENSDKPVFIYIHTMEPHVPYEVPDKERHFSRGASHEILRTLYEKVTKSPHYPSLDNPSIIELETLKALYKDAVLQAYKYFNSVHDYLYVKGILHDSSLLILTADHGERFFKHGSWIHGPPDVYNEVLKIPLMIKGSKIIPGIYDQNVQLLDLYPTIMDWMGEKSFKFFPGTSLIKYISQGADMFEDRVIYADGTGNLPQYAYFRDNMKIIVNANKIEVYDLMKDPGETDNIADKELFSGLVEEAKSFRKQFERSMKKMSRELSAEERKKLKALGYIYIP